jgi:dTDP-4-amino-4,6-dideoxygalactose transaminase
MSSSTLAYLGGSPINTQPLPLYNTIGDEEKRAVMAVLDSGVLSGFAAQPNNDHLGGGVIRSLEAAFCETFGVRHAIAVNSATSGLHAMVAATRVGPGDEVIVPPYTMTASATAVLFTGAVPIFADIDDEIFCLDPASVEAHITPRTRGIMAVNLYGHPARLRELRAIADRQGLFLLEDNAQSPLAMIDGRYSGTFGQSAVFSLNRHKVMQCGEGGIVITDDDDIAARCRLLRNHGEVLVGALGIEDITNTIGLNYRMTNMEAAVAREQFRKLPGLTEKRIALADHLSARLADIPGITPPTVLPGYRHVYYFHTMKYDAGVTGIPRDLFVKAVCAEGFQLAAGYVKPLYLEPLYQQRICFGPNGAPFSFNPDIDENTYSKGICPVVERLQESDLMWTSMIYPPLTTAFLDRFVEAILKVLDNRDALLAAQGIREKVA